MSRWGAVLGTIYAERSKTDPRMVRLYSRHWDGIDRPEYTTLQSLSSDEARYLAQQLLEEAEKVDGKSKKDRKLAKERKLRREILKQAKETAKAAKAEAEG